jgi:UMF1 family MFS transporter
MLKFLMAYWLYIDGVNTVVVMAVDYGMALGLKSADLLGALLLTQFVAFPAALLFGRLGERYGARAGVLGGLAVYVLLTIWAFYLDSIAEFYLMAATLGLVQGGVQSLSRSLFGRMVPEGKSAEYFGFYNMVSKFGTVLGPALMGSVALLTGSTRASILALLLLFIGGAVLLWRVRLAPATSPESRLS